jgi:hypothetical protein
MVEEERVEQWYQCDINFNDYVFYIYLKNICNFLCEYSLLLIQWGVSAMCMLSIIVNKGILAGGGAILNWTTTVYLNNPRRRVILDRESDDDYLERYYLFLKDRQQFPFNIFLHKFCKSDPTDLHDHPWAFVHIILYGGYWETVAIDGDPRNTVKKWRSPGYINYVTADHMHKIELDDTKPKPITLFVPFKQQGTWGFYKVDGDEVTYIEHEAYFEMKKHK